MNNIYKYGNIRQCSKKQTFLIYIVHFLDTNNISQSILQPVHRIQSHVLRCTLTCEDQWSPKTRLFPLHTSTPHELTADPDIHTEHYQMPHVHVNSCTCRNTVLYYTAVPLYTGSILNRDTALHLYTSKIISDILTRPNKPFFIIQDYAIRDISTATTTTNYYYYYYYYYYHQHHYTFGTLLLFLTPWGWHLVPPNM